MRTVRSKLSLTLVSSAIAVMLAACGGSDDDNTSTPNTPNTPTTPVVPTLSFTDPQQSVDLANYRQVGRYDLPVGTGNQLAEEASGIAYNKTTGTLFIVGDEGTGIVEVNKQGVQVSAMALTGTADVEGIAYLGGSQFVYVEERLRSLHRFNYNANTTLDESATQSVKLGTTIGNIGIEGVSFDPTTNGFIAVKEASPSGVIATTVDFAAGTASNGSPATVNSTNLFDPAKTGLPALNDVFVLANALSSTAPDYDQMLIISAGAGKVVKMDRTGNLMGTLDIGPAQNEGLTMDDDRNIYTVNENGGGAVGHPQMLVFAPTTSATAVGLGSNLYLGFSQAVSAGTGNLTLSDGTGDVRTIAVGDATQVQFRGNTVIVNPKADLRPGHSYRITYPAGVLKLAGANAPAVNDVTALAFKADGTVDATAPTLASSTPADNASNVTASAAISLVFSELVQAGTGNIVIDNAAGDRRVIPVGDSQVVISRDTVIVTPATPLIPFTTYSVQIDAGALTDASANAFAGIAGTTTLNFTTAPQPTTLQAGDLVFLAVNGDDPTDAISFILLKPINAGTAIGLTDRDWTAASIPTNEAAYVWTADVNYAVGTVITIQTNTLVANKGALLGKGGGISTTNETYYAFQGTIAGLAPNAAGPLTVDRFLAAINVGTAAGEIPAELNTAGSEFYISLPQDNIKYTGSLDTSNVANFLAAWRNTGANWTFDDAANLPMFP